MQTYSKEEYNSEPVFYCKRCLSLLIKDAGIPDLLYCDECSGTDIGQTSIEEWDRMYVEKYGFHYLDNKIK